MVTDSIKIHLGCGPHLIDGWFNYDLEWQASSPRTKVSHFQALDLRRRLPHSDGTVDYAFSEHFIEHIDKAEGAKFLAEVYRVLKPGGVLRISTPDLQHLVYSYIKMDLSEWSPTWCPKTPCDLLNEGMRLWGHKYLYDLSELCAALALAGFKRTSVKLWHDSSFDVLKRLEVRPPRHDLIVEAVKS